MSRFIIFLSILLIVTGFSLPESGDPDRSYIVWTPGQKLTWNDFQGPPKRMSHFAAMTIWKLGYSVNYENGEMVMKVTAKFNPTQSWVKPDARKPSILAHEQLHFDIAELNARLLRKTWSEFRINPRTLQRDSERLFNDAWDATVEMQDTYDKETDHGLIKAKQAAWEKRVARELERLAEFAE